MGSSTDTSGMILLFKLNCLIYLYSCDDDDDDDDNNNNILMINIKN
jgi:hypothetical protein